MGQASVAVGVKAMSFSAARKAPLIEERSGAGKRCRGDVVLGVPCSTADRGAQWGKQASQWLSW